MSGWSDKRVPQKRAVLASAQPSARKDLAHRILDLIERDVSLYEGRPPDQQLKDHEARVLHGHFGCLRDAAKLEVDSKRFLGDPAPALTIEEKVRMAKEFLHAHGGPKDAPQGLEAGPKDGKDGA